MQQPTIMDDLLQVYSRNWEKIKAAEDVINQANEINRQWLADEITDEKRRELFNILHETK